MLRIRFHGRGGQGVKTASRIIGSAAYLAGYQAQDSPLYGAERRGAPVVAFARIDEKSILERGIIPDPDLIIVADETLLADPLAGVLTGQEAASAIFVNTDAPESIRDSDKIKPPLTTYDVTALTLEKLGKASALSAGLAGAAAKLSGLITEEQLVEATTEELSSLGGPPELLENNIAVARRVFNDLSKPEIEHHDLAVSDKTVRLEYEDPVRSAPDILNTGNAILKKTGNWRVEEPVIDRALCTRCGLCPILCPDGAITLDKEAYPVIDYDHCKGCMICRQICPPKAISTRKEVKAW